jgi:hypothetical protein
MKEVKDLIRRYFLVSGAALEQLSANIRAEMAHKSSSALLFSIAVTHKVANLTSGRVGHGYKRIREQVLGEGLVKTNA